MLHIGILGHSADGATLCLLEMVRESARQRHPHEHPEITMSLLPMGPTLPAYDRSDLAAVRAYLGLTAQRLAAAGCAFFACPDNTAHIALELPGPALPLPGLHIAELVAQRAHADGRRRIGLLGTRWTMDGPVYPAAFRRAGVDHRVPTSSDRKIVDDIIFEELCQGVIRESSRAECLRIVDGLRREGCDAVALSCTELPLLINPEISPLPTLDSTRLLSHAAVAVALEQAPLPSWFGGPVT